MQSPFIPNQVYNRRADIHAHYGGSWQDGIAPSAKYPFIFIFSGKSGEQHGYKDGWDNPNVFSYTGKGQVGDMKFTSGNLALRDHLYNGKHVFLFESVKKGYVRFITELEFFDVDYFETPDRNGDMRIAIKFFFKRVGVSLPLKPKDILTTAAEDDTPSLDFVFPNETERKGLVTSRVGQGAYRKRIIHRWEYQCAVTGFDKLNVLIASHILPWAEADHQQRLDIHNGILLSPTYDALFDRSLISFENSGKIILSDAISIDAFQRVGVTGKEKIQKFNFYNFEYLDKHRASFHMLNQQLK